MANVSGDNKALLSVIAEKAKHGEALNAGEMKRFVGCNEIMANITQRLPMHLKANAEKYSKQALSLFTANPDLQQCAPMTIVNAMVIASSLGLDLTPQLGQAYIIPYKTRKKVGRNWIDVNEAQFQLGYKGAIDLMYRSGQVSDIYGYEVREGDHFVFKKGLNRVLEHEDSNAADRENRPITHVYMVIRLKDGGALFDVWSYDKLIAHAVKYSRGAVKRDYKTGEVVLGPDGRPQLNEKSPWSSAFIPMAKKTILMSLRASAPLSVELMNAFEVENKTVKDSEINIESDTVPAALVEMAPYMVSDVDGVGTDSGLNADFPSKAEILPVDHGEVHQSDERARQAAKEAEDSLKTPGQVEK